MYIDVHVYTNEDRLFWYPRQVPACKTCCAGTDQGVSMPRIPFFVKLQKCHEVFIQTLIK